MSLSGACAEVVADRPLGQQWTNAVEKANEQPVRVDDQRHSSAAFAEDQVEAHVYQMALERRESWHGGSLPFTVQGALPRDIGSRFGAPCDGGARKHHGVDIFAKRGTPVIAVTDGRVRTGTAGIGGNHVWLSGGLRLIPDRIWRLGSKMSHIIAHRRIRSFFEGIFLQKSTVVFSLVAILGVSGCASNASTFGDRVSAEDGTSMGLAEQWKEGSTDVAEGNKLIKRGRKTMQNAESRYQPKK